MMQPYERKTTRPLVIRLAAASVDTFLDVFWTLEYVKEGFYWEGMLLELRVMVLGASCAPYSVIEAPATT